MALDTPLTREHRFILEWLGLIAAVVFSTVQTQDMADQVGDRLRHRRSMPLTLGDGSTRWITALLMIGWSVCCALYWDVINNACIMTVVLGLAVAWRTLNVAQLQV